MTPTRRHRRIPPARLPLRARRIAWFALLAGAVAASAAVALTMVGPAPADTAPKTVALASGPTAVPAVVRVCGTATAVSPATLPLWCATPAQSLDTLSWSSWGGSTATATGDLRDTACFCVGARVREYPVTVSLTAPKAAPAASSQAAPGRVYTSLTLTFPGARPAWAYKSRFAFAWTASGYLTEETI